MNKKLSKIALGLGVLLFSAPNAHALLGFGLKGGMGLSKLSYQLNGNSIATNTSFQTGFLLGGSATFDVGPVGVMADILWARRGFDSLDGTQQARGNYLHIPVQAKLSIIPMLFVSGGMYYSRALGDTLSLSDSNGNALGNTTYAGAALSKNDFGLVAGLGVSVPAGVTSITAEIRFNFGLSDLNTGLNSSRANHLDFLVGATF